MKCFVFKPRRRVDGVLHVTRFFSGKLRMPWESKPTVIALETTDRRIAERMLDEIAKQRHLERQGYSAPREVVEAMQRPLAELLGTFLADASARGRAPNTLAKYRHGLRKLFERCRWKKLGDVTPSSFCEWRASCDLKPKTKNDAMLNASAFLNWLKKQRIIRENPLHGVERVDTRLTPQFRRALTPDEAQKLLAAAPPTRAVVYLVLLETGLRRSELSQLVLGDFDLDSPTPCVHVRASITKTKKEASIPLRSEVIRAIRSILPENAMPFEFIFRGKLPRIPTMKKDLAKAGIPFLDASGRRVDLHALRETFCTNLSATGVYPRVAMELMRHRDIRQTMKTYTDAAQLPLATAIAGLPSFSLPCANGRQAADDASKSIQSFNLETTPRNVISFEDSETSSVACRVAGAKNYP
jgi:integrase